MILKWDFLFHFILQLHIICFEMQLNISVIL